MYLSQKLRCSLLSRLFLSSDWIRHCTYNPMVGLGKTMEDTSPYDGLWPRFEFISRPAVPCCWVTPLWFQTIIDSSRSQAVHHSDATSESIDRQRCCCRSSYRAFLLALLRLFIIWRVTCDDHWYVRQRTARRQLCSRNLLKPIVKKCLLRNPKVHCRASVGGSLVLLETCRAFVKWSDRVRISRWFWRASVQSTLSKSHVLVHIWTVSIDVRLGFPCSFVWTLNTYVCVRASYAFLSSELSWFRHSSYTEQKKNTFWV